ncbi:hypothetical protein CFR71_11680 [Novacetimonas pomaceti]|uniref:Uncharacterized protein n=1 Tax=Novacetimonas pomaceti TaxID=2021998 RepID=A0A318QCP8_9PROT|nr:hypothetical protein CFR71_11680 [Novacetimonas pomaceti]
MRVHATGRMRCLGATAVHAARAAAISRRNFSPCHAFSPRAGVIVARAATRRGMVSVLRVFPAAAT